MSKKSPLNHCCIHVLKQTNGLFQNPVSGGRSGRWRSQARAATSNRGCRARGSNGHKPKERRVEARKREVGEITPFSSKWIIILFLKKCKWSVENKCISRLSRFPFYWLMHVKLDCLSEVAWRLRFLCSVWTNQANNGGIRQWNCSSSTRHPVSLHFRDRIFCIEDTK